MSYIFGFLSFIAWFVGLINVNTGTAGVFCAATACWLAILIRIYVAGNEHAALMNFLIGQEQERLKRMSHQ